VAQVGGGAPDIVLNRVGNVDMGGAIQYNGASVWLGPVQSSAHPRHTRGRYGAMWWRCDGESP